MGRRIYHYTSKTRSAYNSKEFLNFHFILFLYCNNSYQTQSWRECLWVRIRSVHGWRGPYNPFLLFNAGPGPGAYGLPPTIGYEHHDNRKQRLPQYSFGTRTLIYGADPGPGPGAYQVDKLTRYGPGIGPEYTMGGITKIIGRLSAQLSQTS